MLCHTDDTSCPVSKDRENNGTCKKCCQCRYLAHHESLLFCAAALQVAGCRLILGASNCDSLMTIITFEDQNAAQVEQQSGRDTVEGALEAHKSCALKPHDHDPLTCNIFQASVIKHPLDLTNQHCSTSHCPKVQAAGVLASITAGNGHWHNTQLRR
jgi:hypothetical protein